MNIKYYGNFDTKLNCYSPGKLADLTWINLEKALNFNHVTEGVGTLVYDTLGECHELINFWGPSLYFQRHRKG